MPLPPYPVMPAPRTWSPGDQILTSRLRADLGNAALLLANRPMFVGAQTTTGQSIPDTNTLTNVDIDTEYLDSWNRHQIPSASYPAPLGGWYLLEGDTGLAATNSGDVSAGIGVVQAGVTTIAAGGSWASNTVNATQPVASVLAQLDPTTSDSASLMCRQSSTAATALTTAKFKAEWVAQPTTLGYGTGTVVTSPQPAAVWPAGSGTDITNGGGIAAGATSMTVAAATGMVAGGYLGLDFYEGQPVSPMAETVQITSVAGVTIGITATSYPHGGTASPGLVAVPVSAAWMNQQARDMISFLSYPPIAHVWYGTGGTSSLPAQTWPAATAITWGTSVVDNFGGWSGSKYTFPVSGVYYIYGQVAAVAAQPVLSAGYAISGGQINWGTTVHPFTAANVDLTATVRRHARVTAGQYVQLFGSSNIAVGLPTNYSGTSRLVVVFRSF